MREEGGKESERERDRGERMEQKIASTLVMERLQNHPFYNMFGEEV